MYFPVFSAEFRNRRLIALIGAVLVCLSWEVRSVEAACGDWLASHGDRASQRGEQLSNGKAGTNWEAGRMEVPSGSCGCKGLRCRPGNPQGNLPDQVVRLFDGNWGVLPSSDDPTAVDRSDRLSDERRVSSSSIASSIFHPPRSV